MRFLLLPILPFTLNVLALSNNIERNTSSGLDTAKKLIIEATAHNLLLKECTVTVLKTFKSEVFSGLSIKTETENLDTLEDHFLIAKAWRNNLIHLPAAINPSSVLDSDVGAKNYSVHAWTGVDKLHEAGIFGKGVTVALIDTGIDHRHDALGGCFGPGCKVIGGYDLVGDGRWPALGYEKEPDEDPMDFQGHGSHVAGIVAGNGDWFKGVAPEASLLIYKVFTPQEETDEDTIIEAFLMAYEANADIITASLSGIGGFSNGAWATVASRIADKGVIVTIAAGNYGDDGPFFGSSGASGASVLAIASAEAATWPAAPFWLTYQGPNGENKTDMNGYNWYRDQWDIKDWPIVPFSLNITEDNQACLPLPAGEYPDWSEKIVLVRRGGCDFKDQEMNLRAAYTSIYVMYYNNDESPITPWTDNYEWPKALVDKAVGEAIIETIKTGGSVTADFTPNPDYNFQTGIFSSLGNRPNQFTSWGGLYNMDSKPDLAAPGGDILSTFIYNSWRVMSGTSQACPYVAGVAALYIGKYGGRDIHGEGFGKMLRDKIVSSGAAMPWSTIMDFINPSVETGFLAPTIQVGSGLIDAYKVLTYTTNLKFDKFNLNDTLHFSRYHKVEIKNNAKVPVTYTFTVQPAAGIEAKAAAPPGLAPLAELKPIKMVPSVSFPTGTFKVLPGQSKIAQFNFDYPKGLNEARLPVFSGKILISGSNGEELSIPYFGGGFNVKKEFNTMFETAPGFETIARIGPDNADLFDHTTVSFDLYNAEYIRIYASLKWGCSELRWDIFKSGFKERSWTYPPVVGQNGYVGSVAVFREAEVYNYVDPVAMDVEDTIPFPLRSESRNSPLTYPYHTYFWLGKLADGTYLKAGNYSMRFAALRPFGTPSHSDNWDVFETPVINVLFKPHR